MRHVEGALIAAIALAAHGCAGDPIEPVGTCPRTVPDHPRAAEYQQALETHCRGARAPGCVLLVARDGEPVWVGATGFADLETGAPMCTDTPFRIASISKVYVAALVLGLVERDRLALDDRLGELLPEVAREIPGGDAITVEHLLAHRSGLSSPDTDDLALQLDFFDRPGELARVGPEERLRRYVYGRALRFAPGARYRYSNSGYDLLGMIAERVEGAPLEALLARDLFAPVGLSSTALADVDDPRIAHGYAATGEGLLLDVTTADAANVGPRSPSGGLVATAGDVHAFFEALLGGELVDEATLASMQAQRCDDPSECTRGYGLGLNWDRTDEPLAVGHAGALIGVASYAYRFPTEGLTVVLFRNVKRSTADDMAFLRSLTR